MRLRSTDVSTRTIGGETIVLHLPDSQYFSVTGIGTRVFELLGEDRTVDELIEMFVDRLRDARLLV
jgi:hypothetical protein